jgi:hypothetical protein
MAEVFYTVTVKDAGGQKSHTSVSDIVDGEDHGDLAVATAFKNFIDGYTMGIVTDYSMSEHPTDIANEDKVNPYPGYSVDSKYIVWGKGVDTGHRYHISIPAPLLYLRGEAPLEVDGVTPLEYQQTEHGRRPTQVAGQLLLSGLVVALSGGEPVIFTRGLITESK